MNQEAKSCYIYTENKSLPSIYLPNNVAINIGRNINTQITDLKCSRDQVRLCANYEERVITVEQIGVRSSGLNGTKTMKGEKYLAKHGDELELIYGKYLYKIEFNPIINNNNNKNFEVKSIIKRNKIKKRSHADLDSENDDDDDDDDENCENSQSRKKLKNTLTDDDDHDDGNLINDNSIASGSRMKCPIDMFNLKEDNDTWEAIDNNSLMIFTSSGVEGREKIASYDMDGTLITTQSGNVFPKDNNDWKLLYSDVPNQLKKFYNDGYKIVIFTNQGALGLGKSKPSEFKKKIERVVKKLAVPTQVFIATGRDRYRKPMIGMWETLMNKNNNVNVNKNDSFYVGDAAGRPKNWQPKAKKDHSMVDRLFAINIGLKFQTPEEHFLKQKPVKFNEPSFNPKHLKTDINIFEPNIANNITTQEVIILVGGPGSGKSYVATKYLKDYVRINRDTLGSWQKCVSAMKTALDDGKSVIIDNTNPDIASRQRFLEVAKAHNVSARCFIMNTSLENAKHNNRYRELTDSSHMIVSDIIINTYIKNYVEPSINEGFKEIVRVNFVPKFDSDDHRKLYQMYLLEK